MTFFVISCFCCCCFPDCCPHLYCCELKHNISVAVSSKPYVSTNNNKDENDSPKNHNQNKTHQASSQNFRQIIVCFMFNKKNI